MAHPAPRGTRVRHPRLLCRGAVAVVQEGGEQRGRRLDSAAPLGQPQRGVLVAQQLGQLPVHLPHGRLRPLRVHPDPDRERVQEQPQHPVRALAPLHAAEEHRPEHHVVPPRRPRQHLPPRDVAHARRAHAQRPCPRPQPGRQLRPHHLPRRLDPRPVAPDVKQAERRRGLLHAVQQRAEVRLVLRPARAPPRLCHEGAEGERGGQLRLPALQVRPDLLVHHLRRGVVADQVVLLHQQQPAVFRRIVRHGGPHQGRPAEVQPGAPRVEPVPQRPCGVALGGVRLHLLHRQPRPAPHHLHGLRQPLPYHRGAQDVVPGDHGLQRVHVRVQLLPAVEADQPRDQVGIALARQQVVEEDPLLQRRQRVDVLHVGRAAVHPRHDPVDLRLGERHQRQHLRRDPPGGPPSAVFADEVPQRRLVRAQLPDQLGVQGVFVPGHDDLLADSAELDPGGGERRQKRLERHRTTSSWPDPTSPESSGSSPGIRLGGTGSSGL